jgi:micrococcal nuclease
VLRDRGVQLHRTEARGQRVRLEFDVERHDTYGRTLAYVWVGHELFNETLVRLGYASVTTYPPDVKHVQVLRRAQRAAQKHRRGLWGKCVGKASGDHHSRDPSYPSVCVPPPPPALDCADITFRRFEVLASDPHNFDADHNGIGCESG